MSGESHCHGQTVAAAPSEDDPVLRARPVQAAVRSQEIERGAVAANRITRARTDADALTVRKSALQRAFLGLAYTCLDRPDRRDPGSHPRRR